MSLELGRCRAWISIVSSYYGGVLNNRNLSERSVRRNFLSIQTYKEIFHRE